MNLRRVKQITESHCGPAVAEVLLDSIGIQCDQELISKAAGVEESIMDEGTRIDQLALAVVRVAPEARFWYKFESSIDDIRYLLSQGYAVGIEWQGLFYDSEAEEKNEGEHGHYSIITDIDEENSTFIIRDPYEEYFHHDRIFPINTFLRRWWDTNNVEDPTTHQIKIVEDVRPLFFVTRNSIEFPQELGFKLFTSIDTFGKPSPESI